MSRARINDEPANCTATTPQTADEMCDAFVEVINLVEPDHPHVDDPWPITTEQVAFDTCRSDASKYASCGPRHSTVALGGVVVSYTVREGRMAEMTPHRHLAVILHELTHVTVGRHSHGHSGHPRAFWERLAEYARRLENVAASSNIHLDAFEGAVKLQDVYEAIVYDEVNHANVDRRYWSNDDPVRTCQRFMADELLGVAYTL